MIITDALVLHRTAYRDNDRMVTLFSPDHGRLDAIARGCLKARSPLTNATELFCAGEYELHETHGRLSVAQCRIQESFFPLREQYERLTHASYLLRLLLTVVQPGDENRRLFLTALRALAFFSYGNLPEALVTMAFELHLLSCIGQAPRMDSCGRCGKPIEGPARFDPSRGGTICLNCPASGRRISNGARRILLRVPQTRFEVIDKLEDRPEWPEAAHLTRAFIQGRLELHPSVWPELPDLSQTEQS